MLGGIVDSMVGPVLDSLSGVKMLKEVTGGGSPAGVIGRYQE